MGQAASLGTGPRTRASHLWRTGPQHAGGTQSGGDNPGTAKGRQRGLHTDYHSGRGAQPYDPVAHRPAVLLVVWRTGIFKSARCLGEAALPREVVVNRENAIRSKHIVFSLWSPRTVKMRVSPYC